MLTLFKSLSELFCEDNFSEILTKCFRLTVIATVCATVSKAIRTPLLYFFIVRDARWDVNQNACNACINVGRADVYTGPRAPAWI